MERSYFFSICVSSLVVFKVLTIEEEEFVEKVNLRVGRNLNLNFSASDVTWNPVEGLANH